MYYFPGTTLPIWLALFIMVVLCILCLDVIIVCFWIRLFRRLA